METFSLTTGKNAHDFNYDKLSQRELWSLWIDTANELSKLDPSANHVEYVYLNRKNKSITEALSKYESTVKEHEKESLNQGGKGTTTPNKMPKAKKERLAYLKSTIKEGDCLDEATGHLLREVNGDLVEHKYCSHCGEWHPITDFHKCSANRDGLFIHCKKCRSINQKEQYRKKRETKGSFEPVTIVPGETCETSVVPSEIQRKLDEIDALNNNIREEAERNEQEIKRLQEENETLKRQTKDLDKLSEADIKRILASNAVTPRLLIDTLYGKSGDYHVYVFNKELGRDCFVKPDEQPSFSRQCA